MKIKTINETNYNYDREKGKMSQIGKEITIIKVLHGNLSMEKIYTEFEFNNVSDDSIKEDIENMCGRLLGVVVKDKEAK